MNKNIKDEFDNLINDQTPDLWERIESALPEKTPFVESNEKKNRKYNKYVAYGTVGAAACLCIVLFSLGQKPFKSQDKTNGADNRQQDMVYEDVSEDMLDEAMEEAETEGMVAKDTVVEDTEMTGMAAEDSAEELQDLSDAEKESLQYTQMQNGIAAESAVDSRYEAKKDDIQSKIQMLKEEGLMVYESILVRVDSVSETMQGENSSLVYHITLLQDAGYLEKGKQLDLKADELYQNWLEEGESCRITFYDNKMPADSSVHEYFLLDAEKENY